MDQILLFILGATIASFSYSTAKHFQEGKNYLGQSLCDYCHHPLKWWQLIPIIEYSLQKGKCYFCNSQTKIQSALLELCFGSLFINFLLPYPYILWPKYIFLLGWLLILSLEDFFTQYVSTQLLLWGIIFNICINYHIIIFELHYYFLSIILIILLLISCSLFKFSGWASTIHFYLTFTY